MEHLSVAIADDNQRILDMLDDIIQTDKELDLVGKAKNGEEMCQIIKDRQPEVVLLDLISNSNIMLFLSYLICQLNFCINRNTSFF